MPTTPSEPSRYRDEQRARPPALTFTEFTHEVMLDWARDMPNLSRFHKTNKPPSVDLRGRDANDDTRLLTWRDFERLRGNNWTRFDTHMEHLLVSRGVPRAAAAVVTTMSPDQYITALNDLIVFGIVTKDEIRSIALMVSTVYNHNESVETLPGG